MSVVCLIEPEYLKKSSRAELNSCLEKLIEKVPNMTLKRQLKAKNKALCTIDRSLTRFCSVCFCNLFDDFFFTIHLLESCLPFLLSPMAVTKRNWVSHQNRHQIGRYRDSIFLDHARKNSNTMYFILGLVFIPFPLFLCSFGPSFHSTKGSNIA